MKYYEVIKKNRQRGSTLLNLMILAAILGGAVLIFIRQQGFDFNAFKALKFRSELDSIRRFVLSNIDCDRTFTAARVIENGKCTGTGTFRLYGNAGILHNDRAFRKLKQRGWELRGRCLSVEKGVVVDSRIQRGNTYEESEFLDTSIYAWTGPGNAVVGWEDKLCGVQELSNLAASFYADQFALATSGCSNVNSNRNGRQVGSDITVEVPESGNSLEIAYYTNFDFPRSNNPQGAVTVNPILELSGPVNRREVFSSIGGLPFDSFATPDSGRMIVNNLPAGTYTVRAKYNARSDNWSNVSGSCEFYNVIVKQKKSL